MGGPRWAWAHDGDQCNGWIRLQVGRRLSSKWGGAGTWRLLEHPRGRAVASPLLVVAFNGVEHTLRLRNGVFDVIMKRQLLMNAGLPPEEVCKDSLFDPDVAACCPTRGW